MVLFCLCSSQKTKQNQSKPNFIIIFTDDQGYQDLGCYGSPNIKTPNIDKMASEGMKFTSFYAQNRLWTIASCFNDRVLSYEKMLGTMME